MKTIALLLALACSSCTVAKSHKGDYWAEVGTKRGILTQNAEDHQGGLQMLPVGSVSTVTGTTEQETQRESYVNIGGPDGITIKGPQSQGDPVRVIGGVVRATERFKVVEKLGSEAIKGAVDITNHIVE